MYTYTRAVQFKSISAAMSAMPLCAQIASHMTKELGIETRLMRPVMGGHPARLLFVVKSDSLDEGQKNQDKSLQDAKFREMVTKLGEFTDGSKTSDQMWQDI